MAKVFMFATIAFFCMFIAGLFKLVRWLIIGKPATGTIGEAITNTKPLPPGAPCNEYKMDVECKGIHYRHSHRIAKERYIEPGTNIRIRWDAARHEYVVFSDLLKEVGVYFILFAVSGGILLAIALLATS